MVLGQKRWAAGMFPNRQQMEYALQELHNAGFPMKHISVVAKDVNSDAQISQVGIDSIEDAGVEVPRCAIAGSMLGAIGGCFVGLGFFVVPGLLPIIAVGSFGTALAATVAGTGIGLISGSLLDTLAGMGIFKEQLPGEYLVIVDGTDKDVRHAQSILSRSCSSKVWVC